MPGVEATIRSDALRDGQGAATMPVKLASVSFTSSGDLVALVSGSRIRVVSIVLVASGSLTVQLTDGTNSVNLTGAMSMVVGVPLVLPWNPHGWVQTAVSGKLSVVQSGSGTVSGCLTYVLPNQ